ncbi:hypothetical protein Tco_1236866, partial [Tanacetum coccineum]
DMSIIDEVVFKIHKKGVFEFDPLSSTLISSKLKRNSSKKIKEGLRKKGKAVGRMLIDSCDKGKEKVDEFPATTPTKEHQVVVTNYKRAIVNGKAKMVKVVAPFQENVDVGIKQEDRRRKNVLSSMAPANFVSSSSGPRF